jgi:hypothetical protein
MRQRLLILAAWGLVLLGCGGATTPRVQFSYAEPESSGFRFVRNGSLSNPGLLVLDLVGPELEAGRGVAFTLTVDAAVATWVQIGPGATHYLENLAFDLGPGEAALRSQVSAGTLQGMVFQKGPGNPKLLAAPLCRVALALAGPRLPRTQVALAVQRFQFLPAQGSALQEAPCAVGALDLR